MESKVAGSFFSTRRLGWAGLAAIVGCSVCFLAPLTALVLGSGAAAAVSSVVWPGLEIAVGLVAFAGALGVMALRRRSRGRACATR